MPLQIGGSYTYSWRILLYLLCVFLSLFLNLPIHAFEQWEGTKNHSSFEKQLRAIRQAAENHKNLVETSEILSILKVGTSPHCSL